MRYLAASVLVMALSSVPLPAAGQTKWQAPPSSWSAGQVKALLEDSPWAGKATVRAIVSASAVTPVSHATGFALPEIKKAVVTWESASLVRQARARAGHRVTSGDPKDGPTYSVSMRISASASVRLSGSRLDLNSMDMVVDEAALQRRGKPDLAPLRVEKHWVDSKGNVKTRPSDACRPLPPAQHTATGMGGFQTPAGFVTSGPPSNQNPVEDRPCKDEQVFVFYFPASDAIGSGEMVAFFAVIGGASVTRTFETSQMVLNGTVDLR